MEGVDQVDPRDDFQPRSSRACLRTPGRLICCRIPGLAIDLQAGGLVEPNTSNLNIVLWCRATDQ